MMFPSCSLCSGFFWSTKNTKDHEEQGGESQKQLASLHPRYFIYNLSLLYKLLITSLSLLTPLERRRIFFLTVCQALICISDLAALALLVLVVGTFSQTSLVNTWTNIPQTALLLFILVFFILKNYFAFTIQQYQFRLVYDIAARLSKRGLEQYFSGPYEDYSGMDSSVWVRRISQQPVEFAQYVLTGFQVLFTESLLVAGATTILLLYNAQLFLLLLAVLLPAMAVVLYFTRKRLQQVRTSIKKNSELNLQYLQESLHGYVESNLFDKHAYFSNRYGDQQQQLNRHLAQLQSTNLLPSRMMESFAVAGLCLLAALQFYFSGNVPFDIITLGAFLAGAYKLIPGIVRIINTHNTMKTFAFAANNLAMVSNETSGNADMQEEPLHSICFREVSFRLDNRLLLETVSFQLKAGELTGMTAPSGKGKTTLINLLLGFREATAGSIHFNDQPLSASERKKWWGRISYVKQQPFVLHDTLEQNITMESPSIFADGVEKVTSITSLQDWMHPDTPATAMHITEAGKNISGGQQQRIALARALNKEADLYILDEPFQALDTNATALLLNHLQELASSGKMILVISHDPFTMSRCNQIINLT